MDYHVDIYPSPFDTQTPETVVKKLSADFRKRRLEKGLSRGTVSMMSGVPTATLRKFETDGAISLKSFTALCKSLGYASELEAVLSQPKYSTLKELETIESNLSRKRGRL